MDRRRKGFIELEWTCPNCSTRNRGAVKTCENCGAPQPEDVQFEAPAKKKFVSDETAKELKQRGADVHCGFCGTRNPSDATTCSQCGADLKEGQARESGREIDISARDAGSVFCANCGTENSAAKVNCVGCGAPLPGAGTQPDPGAMSFSMPGAVSDQPAPKKKPNWLLLGGIGAVLLVCCIAALFLFVFPSQSVQATVTDVTWQTSVPVQEIQAVNYTNQRGSPPSSAYNVSCETDTQEICEERTIDRGDGYAEVVEDCRTVTEQFCDYTVDEWTTIQTYTLEGFDYSPVYEQPNLASDQRLGEQSVEFVVSFDTNEGVITYSPGTLSEFQRFQIGSQWTLKLNALGGVVSIEK